MTVGGTEPPADDRGPAAGEKFHGHIRHWPGRRCRGVSGDWAGRGRRRGPSAITTRPLRVGRLPRSRPPGPTAWPAFSLTGRR